MKWPGRSESSPDMKRRSLAAIELGLGRRYVHKSKLGMKLRELKPYD